MTAQVRPETVLARTAEAVGHQLDHWSASDLARHLGVSRTSISRDWRDNLAAWPWSAGIRFTCLDATLRAEHLAALAGAPPVLPQGTAAAATCDLARRFAREVDLLIGRASDGNLTPIERARTEDELDALATQITQLRALLRAQGRR